MGGWRTLTFALGDTAKIGGVPKHLGERGISLDADSGPVVRDVIALWVDGWVGWVEEKEAV